MTKKYESDQGLREKIVAGVNKLADNVAATMGPKGRNVILQQKDRIPIITKDGVTVARFVTLDESFENSAALILKQAAEETNSIAGDGTTTSTVLARAIITLAQKYLVSGVSPVEMKRGMDQTLKLVIDKLKERSVEVSKLDEITDVATISSNNDKQIGELISEAVNMVGKDGAISVQDGKALDTTLELIEGFKFNSGLISPAFVNNERNASMMHDRPLFLVTDEKVEHVEQIYPTLELSAREKRPLIILADEISGEALAALIVNIARGTLKVAAIKAPAYGLERTNIMKDVALSVGAEFISEKEGKRLEDIKLTDLGSAKTIESNRFNTTIVGGDCDVEKLENTIEILKNEIELTDDLHECEKIQERITRLSSGVAVIHVGGSTEAEMIEKKHRVEDALEAVKSAQDEGIVEGGGLALLKIAQEDLGELEGDQEIGKRILVEALIAPFVQIAENAGVKYEVVIDKVLENSKEMEHSGFNVATGVYCQDMFEEGIVDPVKVTRYALQNAVSAASTLLTVSNAIVEVRDE